MLWLLAIGLLANVGQFFMFRAYQVGEASVVGPVDYTQLLWVGLIGQIFFAEIPSPTLLAGATLIVLSTFYILRQGIKAAAKPPPDAS